MNVSDCTFSGNTAENGGGFKIYSSGTATVTYSTFSGNKAISDGGGIASDTTLTVTNSTISLNSANGGDGGGILTTGTTTVANSIVAGNTAVTEYADIDGNYTDNGGNLASNNSSGTSTINAELAVLADYGGPTNTQLPLPGSPAICAGLAAKLPAGVSTDQRGYPNTNTTYTSGTCVDAGAVQTNYQSVQFTNVPGGGAYTGVTNIAVIPAPIVSVTENGQNIGAIPITLTDASSTVTGLGPELQSPVPAQPSAAWKTVSRKTLHSMSRCKLRLRAFHPHIRLRPALCSTLSRRRRPRSSFPRPRRARDPQARHCRAPL